MNVYKYKADTKEYIGTEAAQLDPLETKKAGKNIYLLPANATFTEPPAKKEGFAMVWGGESWKEVEDHRGTEYWLSGDTYGTPAHEMKELGALPEGATTTAPEQTIEELKSAKLAEVDVWTENKITGGFISSCTGVPVRYDSDRDTQMTVQGDVGTIAQLPELFAENFPDGYPMRGYAEGSEEKGIFLLTIDQLNKWSADLSMHRGNSKKAGWEKQAEVMAAESESELDKIILD